MSAARAEAFPAWVVRWVIAARPALGKPRLAIGMATEIPMRRITAGIRARGRAISGSPRAEFGNPAALDEWRRPIG
jgi:hypothetical protein